MPPEETRPKLNDVLFQLAQRMVRLDPGSLASLRRMDPDGPGEAEFWKLAIDCGLGTTPRHQMVVRLMALFTPKGDPSLGKKLHSTEHEHAFGAVLARTGYPESRLMRFLALPFAQRGEALERMVRWLAQKGHDGVNCTDIGRLLLSDDEWPARKLAETYYRELARKDSTANKDTAA